MEFSSTPPLLQVTLLFNNAGIMPCKPLLAHSEKEIEKVWNTKKSLSEIFSPGVFRQRVLSVLVHLRIPTSDADTQHGRILNIKVAGCNHHHRIAGSYSEYVEHGWGYRDPKSCSLLCLKGLLSVTMAF